MTLSMRIAGKNQEKWYVLMEDDFSVSQSKHLIVVWHGFVSVHMQIQTNINELHMSNMQVAWKWNRDVLLIKITVQS